MADNTKIEWADATLNYVNGCSVHSPGCTNCYAMKQAHRFPVRQGLTTKTKGGMVWNGTVRDNPKALEQALAWKRGRRIFWNAHGDLFHKDVPDEWIDRQIATCAFTPQHTHMILTKRSARMLQWMRDLEAAIVAWFKHCEPELLNEHFPHMAGVIAHPAGPREWPLPNVWLGVSVEDQPRADERVPNLIATPAAIRFISAEPLLSEVSLARLQDGIPDNAWLTWLDELHLVIAGGESGHDARPVHPDWIRLLRDECEATGVAFHFKQWGEWLPISTHFPGFKAGTVHFDGRSFTGKQLRELDETIVAVKVGKKAAGRLLDGVEHNGMPEASHG